MIAACCSPDLAKNFLGDRLSFGGQEDLASEWVSRVILDRDEAEAGAAVPRSLANVAEITRHRRAVHAAGAGIGIDAFTFIESDHQKGGHKSERHRAAQIAQRSQRPQQRLARPLVAWRDGVI